MRHAWRILSGSAAKASPNATPNFSLSLNAGTISSGSDPSSDIPIASMMMPSGRSAVSASFSEVGIVPIAFFF